ncbi:MAG TPA: hypothetical protein VF678_03735 [bacterium]
MHPLIEMANHILATALAQAGTSDTVRVRNVQFDDAGLRISAWLDHPKASGEVQLALRVDPPTGPEGQQQTLRLVVERWPDKLPSALEPLRRVLEKAKVKVELDFSP